MQAAFNYNFLTPPTALQPFVESIGMFANETGEEKEVTILPDARIDLFFWKSGLNPFQVILLGLETAPEQRSIPPHTICYTISFKPLGVEYILNTSIADLLNTAKDIEEGFWDFTTNDFQSFETFHQKALQQLNRRLPKEIDNRKKELFDLIYSSNGELSVHELADKVFWSSRQINRYFTSQFGLSLKAFCTILRFRASLEHIAQGQLFPELNFTDQTHFIKEIKKFSGVVPKELSKNQNDRFILLSVLKQQ